MNELSRGLPAEFINRYFIAAGDQKRKVRSFVREGNCVEEHSILDSLDGIPMMDIILLRNVRKYLSPRQTGTIDVSICNQLNPNGVWIAGTSELITSTTRPR